MQLSAVKCILLSLLVGCTHAGRLPQCENTCRIAAAFESVEPSILSCLNETRRNVSTILTAAQNYIARAQTKTETFEQWKLQVTGMIHRAKEKLERLISKKNALRHQVVLNANMISKLQARKVSNQDIIDEVHWTMQNLRERCSGNGDAPTPCPKRETGKNCAEIFTNGGRESGMYVITPVPGQIPKLVYCDQETDGGGWTYIQHHINNDVNFNKDWIQYQHGFGTVDCNGGSNFWLGNEMIHIMTSQSHQYMRVDLKDWENNERYALYTHFRVGSAATDYTLTVGGYQGDSRGDIGDAFSGYNFGHPDDVAITRQHGMRFTTRDHDRDNFEGNCAMNEAGGWWYNSCSAVNLNGVIYHNGVYNESITSHGFDNGMIWGPWKGAWYSLKEASMKIRPASFRPNATEMLQHF